MICTICLMFTGLFDLQFQVDLLHNIYIHSDRKGRPHTIAQLVFRARSALSARSVYLTYVVRFVRSADLTMSLPWWDLCDLYDLHMCRRLGSV